MVRSSLKGGSTRATLGTQKSLYLAAKTQNTTVEYLIYCKIKILMEASCNYFDFVYNHNQPGDK